MAQTVLMWSVYRRTTPETPATLFASGSDPVASDESPVQLLMSIIARFTGQTVIPEETEPGHWAWYGDHGPAESWVIFGSQHIFSDGPGPQD